MSKTEWTLDIHWDIMKFSQVYISQQGMSLSCVDGEIESHAWHDANQLPGNLEHWPL